MPREIEQTSVSSRHVQFSRQDAGFDESMTKVFHLPFRFIVSAAGWTSVDHCGWKFDPHSLLKVIFAPQSHLAFVLRHSVVLALWLSVLQHTMILRMMVVVPPRRNTTTYY